MQAAQQSPGGSSLTTRLTHQMGRSTTNLRPHLFAVSDKQSRDTASFSVDSSLLGIVAGRWTKAHRDCESMALVAEHNQRHGLERSFVLSLSRRVVCG